MTEFEKNFFYSSENFRIFFQHNFNQKHINHDKPVLVFNYGLVCNNDHWRHQVPFFDQAQFPILLHDYRFHYSSSGNESEIEKCHFKGMANDLNDLLLELKKDKVILLGHSMGVNICLEFCRSYPEKVAGLVLISGTVVPPQDVMFKSNIVEIIAPFVESIYQKAPNLYRQFWQSSYLNPIIRKMVFAGGFNTETVDEEFIQIYMKRIGELHPGIFLKLLREMQGHNIIRDLEHLKSPTLVMGGSEDKIIPNYLQQILVEKLPMAEFYIVKNGSHVPQVDFPKSVNERIAHFLSTFGLFQAK